MRPEACKRLSTLLRGRPVTRAPNPEETMYFKIDSHVFSP